MPLEGPDSTEHLTSDIVLHCFHCHRKDWHFHGLRGTWYWSILVGFTFGLVMVTGPFRCRCCGAWRWMVSDLLNGRFWLECLRKSSYRPSDRAEAKSPGQSR